MNKAYEFMMEVLAKAAILPITKSPKDRLSDLGALDDLYGRGLVQMRRLKDGKVEYAITELGRAWLSRYEAKRKARERGLPIPDNPSFPYALGALDRDAEAARNIEHER